MPARRRVSRLVVILNDNDMSIAPRRWGGLSAYLARLVSGRASYPWPTQIWPSRLAPRKLPQAACRKAGPQENRRNMPRGMVHGRDVV